MNYDDLTVYYLLVNRETHEFESDILFDSRNEALRFARDFRFNNPKVFPIYGWTAKQLGKFTYNG